MNKLFGEKKLLTLAIFVTLAL